MQYREFDSLRFEVDGKVYPMHLKFRAGEQPIVGTSPEYVTFRNMTFSEGRNFVMLGECILGAKAAEALQAGVGDAVISSPAGAFDVAGSFPLKMKVAGVLNPVNSPDDEAVFTDIKTTWVIEGLAHGHENVENSENQMLLKTDSLIIAGPAVLSYTEITEENRTSFHFHGQEANYPIHAIIVEPRNDRERIQLRGRYESRTDNIQMIVPADVVNELVATVFTIRDLVFKAGVFIGIATLCIATLVFILSVRLRKNELNTIRKMGGSGRWIQQVLGLEIVIVLTLSIGTAWIITLFVSTFSNEIIEKWI
nr:ABC transporter permease [Fulvivirga sedimenti]